MPRSYREFTLSFVAALVVTCILIVSMTTNSIANVSAVEANGVGIYWNSNCSNAVSSINWGTLAPSSVKNITVYIRNEEQKPIFLFLSTTNWNPPETSNYLNLGWNYTRGQQTNPGEILQITLTLSVSRYIKGISSFSFDIIVTGSDSLLGDINGDGKVDYKDLGLLAAAYGSKPGDPNWNPNCDADGDNRIGYIDLGLLAKYYGSYWS